MIRYAVLGLVQGLTEFLPISSSGHLVLAQKILGVDPPGLAVEAAAHLGTLLALLLAFRHDLARLARGPWEGKGWREVGLLALATFPLVVLGPILHNPVEEAFGSCKAVGVGLLVTAGTLALGQLKVGRARGESVGWGQALGVGLAQVASLFPGISRSGVTVCAGLVLGVRSPLAARFAFLLGIPAIAGASGFALAQTSWPGPEQAFALVVVAATAFLSGSLAIRLFLEVARRGYLWPFAVYCLILGLLVML